MASKEVHALVTGPISGFIPTPHKAVPEDFTDVTPDVLYFDDVKVAHAVADAIAARHKVLGTHPEDETGAI